MAKAVIGGLLVSTFLTLFVVPTMYTFFARKKLKFEDADERAEAALAAEPESAS
jgi:hypothetical protein